MVTKASPRARSDRSTSFDPRSRPLGSNAFDELAQADDGALALALIDGHPRAARAVWRRYAPLVRGILRRSFGPEHEVEDLVQDVFLQVFDRARTLRNPAAFKSFVISIAVLTIRYEIRRRRVRRWVGLAASPEQIEVEVAHADIESRQALVRFYRLLDSINTRDRTAFVLRFIEGMELSEVSEALGVSVATARRCISRARQRVALLAGRDPFLAEYAERLESMEAS